MLMEFLWSERYRLGVSNIDEQHMELIKRINLFLSSVNDKKESQEILEILAYLEEYVVTHFNDEEALMQAAAYPYLNEHREMHDLYMRRVDSLLHQIKDGSAVSEFSETLESFLLEWLVQHIDVEDRRFIKSLNKENN